MPFSLHFVSVAGFAGLMTAAAFEDLRRLVIPNAIVAALCVLWLLHLATGPSFTLSGSLSAVGCAMAVFLAGTLLYSRRLIGGGDVKLLIVTAVRGGLLTLVLLLSATLRGAFGSANAAAASSLPVPYGVAIAGAAMTVTLLPNLF